MSVPELKRETVLPSSDRGRLAAIVATCSLAGLAGGMALSMLAETHRAARASARAAYHHAYREPVTWLGVTIKDVSKRCDGARVSTVTPHSPAAREGLRRNDVILTYGGDQVCDDDHLVEVVRASSIGATPQMTIRRGAETLVLHPTLAEMPDWVRARELSRR